MSTSRTANGIVIIIALLSVPATFGDGPGFQGLGDLPGGVYHSSALAVSADGLVVVGASESAAGTEGFRWTQESGIVGLGDLPGGGFSSEALGTSVDGSVVVGRSESALGMEAFRWEAGFMTGLGSSPSGGLATTASGVSADGTVIVGWTESASEIEAFRWTQVGGIVGLGDLPGGVFESFANAVSADGSVVVGLSTSASGSEAFRWETGVMTGLGDLPGGAFQSTAAGLSADGSVVVGRGRSGSGHEAFRWENDVMAGLGDLPGGLFSSRAYDVSSNGTVVVGMSFVEGGTEAFIWDATHSMRSLGDVLVSEFSLDLTGWTLFSATGISADGMTIVGRGRNPDGDTEAWIAHLGEAIADCNTNGVPDADDIAAGTSQDCNTNGTPDECEPDADDDGVIDACDACPDSDSSDTVVIDGCDTEVANLMPDGDGCTMADRIAECADGAVNHGAFISAVAHVTNEWKQDGLISGREKSRIQRCAAWADIP